MRRRTSTLRPALYAGLLSLTLLLAGCADEDPQPKFEEPAASPTPEAETAEEFIRRWNDEYNALVAGKPNSWREITAPCAICNESADTIESYYEAGGGATTQGRRILSIKSDPKETRGTYLARVVVDSAPTTYRESATAPEQELPGGRSTYDVTLIREGSAWLVTNYVKAAQ